MIISSELSQKMTNNNYNNNNNLIPSTNLRSLGLAERITMSFTGPGLIPCI